MEQSMDHLPQRERNKQQVRERILNAAFELFKNNGYSRTTMDDIAEQAAISRGTLFNYFPTKDSLLKPFVQEIFQTRIRPAVTIYLNEQHTPLQTLRFLFMNIHEHVLNIPDIEQAFKQEFLRPREVDGEPRRQDGAMLDLIATILRQGEQRGEIRTDTPVEKLARYIGVLYVSIFYSMVMGTSGQSFDYVLEIDSLLTFIERGIAPV
jgi:AcrR family transcriptional regulator